MFGLPAAATSVGNQSSPGVILFSTFPAGTWPGQRIMQGTRKPPSRAVPLPPANGVCPPSGQMKCAAHPLTRKDRLSLADLLDYPFAGPILPAPFLADLPKAPSNFGILNEAENRFYPRILVE